VLHVHFGFLWRVIRPSYNQANAGRKAARAAAV